VKRKRFSVEQIVAVLKQAEVVSYRRGIYRVSERRAYGGRGVPVSTFRYQSRQEPRTALRLRIREIAPVRVRYGYSKIRVLLNREGLESGEEAGVSDLVQLQFVISGTSVSVLPSLLAMISRTLWYMIPLSS
jgi:hypothetical protein